MTQCPHNTSQLSVYPSLTNLLNPRTRIILQSVFLLNYENRRLLTFFWEKLEFWDHINLKGGWYPFEESWSIINAIFCKYCKYYVIFDLWTFLHTFACCMEIRSYISPWCTFSWINLIRKHQIYVLEEVHYSERSISWRVQLNAIKAQGETVIVQR